MTDNIIKPLPQDVRDCIQRMDELNKGANRPRWLFIPFRQRDNLRPWPFPKPREAGKTKPA